MTFAIVAELPLGTYRGNGQDGRPERLPSMARLHSALLCAAGFGPRAVAQASADLGPCESDEAALRWLEENPPDGVHIPALEFGAGSVIAYRDAGALKKSGSTLTIKKSAKPPVAGSAVGGQFVWMWRDAPPPPVRAAIEALCPDVPYLGTTESPVRLVTVAEEVELNYERDPEGGMFTVGTLPIDMPRPGRLTELTAAHTKATGTPPSPSRDAFSSDEKSLSEVPPREAVGPIRYRGRMSESTDVPWSQVVLLPLDRAIPAGDRVRWAVAAHRALVRLIGDGAPSLVTGAYPDGLRRPANRVALQVLDEHMPVAHGGASAPATLALLVPRDADPAEVGVLLSAVESMTALRGPGGRRREIAPDRVQVLEGRRFWEPPRVGHVRLWQTVPAAVPDTRGGRDPDWTFAHAALLSLAFVWKDLLPRVPGRGDAYYRGMAAAVAERGAAVIHASALRSSDVARYVHRINEHAVVRPYHAVTWLGDLAGSGTVLAIGQSRHLGGGLLVPFDVPEGTAASDVRIPSGCDKRS